MTGEWGMHPKFGEQFKLAFYKELMPATAYAIEKYLGSGLIKGIGPVMAKRMVKHFGTQTLDIIEREPERLSEVEGIASGRIDMIAKAWEEQKAIREVMLFLQGHGVSSAYATKIYKQYGDDSIEIVQKNPYQLAQDIFGIGFLTADRIAEKMGFDKLSPERAQAGLIYTLHQASDEGHVCLPYDRLLEQGEKLLEIDRELLRTAVKQLDSMQKVVLENKLSDEGNTPEFMVYLTKYHICERLVAQRLHILKNTPRIIRTIKGPSAVEWVQKQLSITLANQQKEAILTSAMNTVSVITGGPGTGKTTIIKAILRIFQPLHAKIVLAAPTGRAAKRMSEATGLEAKTVHRLLEYNMNKGGFSKNEDYPLEADLVIVDEASMLDLILMHHLLKAIPKGAMLILVGDVDQLPAVGAGNVLKDMIESQAIPVTKLNEIFRQAQSSAIITNAHRIINGKMPEMNNCTADNDFFFFQEKEPESTLDRIIDLVKIRVPRKFGYNSISDIQVLSPMNRGTCGTAILNEKLQEALNPASTEVIRGGRKFRIGDKVMQIRNNYDKNVYNGDIGYITEINTEEQNISVEIDGTDVIYDYSDLDELTLAYAISIHKSQGSEYPVVIIPMTMQHYVMLQRNLIYTSITRGKELVILVGVQKAISIAVHNAKLMMRYGQLKERIILCDNII